MARTITVYSQRRTILRQGNIGNLAASPQAAALPNAFL